MTQARFPAALLCAALSLTCFALPAFAGTTFPSDAAPSRGLVIGLICLSCAALVLGPVAISLMKWPLRVTAVALVLLTSCLPGDSAQAGSLAIIGDCIATKEGVGGGFPGAHVDAKVGARASAIVEKAQPGYDDTVISAGSNDIPWPTPKAAIPAAQARLEATLEMLRARITGRAHWIRSNIPAVSYVQRRVAARHGDTIIPFIPGRDAVHPRSYGPLRRDVRAVLPPATPVRSPPGSDVPMRHQHGA